MEYKVTEIGDKSWLIEEYDEMTSVYMYLLAGKKEAVLIDTGMGFLPLSIIAGSLTKLPVKAILTHGHIDHIGGTAQFSEVYLHEADRETYCFHSKEGRQLFSQYDFPEVKQEVHCLHDGDTFELGDRLLRIIHVPGHSYGSICILDEKNRWLFTGDTCCKANVLLELDFCASVKAYSESIEKLLQMKKAYTVTWPAHHEKPVSTQILEQFHDAAKGILSGEYQGVREETFGEHARILEWKDIGIVYLESRIWE